MASPRKPEGTRRRRWPWVLGGGLGAIVLPLATFVVLLATAADRAVVVRQALELANAQLAGRIEVQKAWLFPDGHFIAHDATIRGPDGALIVRAVSVETRVDLSALASRRLLLRGTKVEGASLFLAVDAKGQLNIAEALLPRAPPAQKTAKPGRAGPGLGFSLEIAGAQVGVDEARFDLASKNRPPLWELRQTTLEGSLALDDSGTLTVSVPALQAEAMAPLGGDLRVGATVRLAGSDLQVSTDAALGDSSLKAKAELDLGTLAGLATVTDGLVGPHLMAQWVPDLEPRGLRLGAAVALQDGILRLASLRASPVGHEPAGEVRASGSWNLANGSAEATVTAKRLDARALFGRFPKTALGFELSAHAQSLSTSDRRLTAHLSMGQSVIGGQPVGPGTAEARFAAAALELTQVDVAFPGGRVVGSGSISNERVSGKARIDAPDLGSLRAALAGMSGVIFPEFSGDLQGEARIEGPWTAPSVTTEVRASHLSLNGLQASGLEAQISAPRLGRPMDLSGRASIAQLRLADRTLDDLGISVAWKTPTLHLDVHARQDGKAIELGTDLRLPSDLKSATVSTLELHASGDDWSLAAPANLDFRNGLSLDRAELRSGPQRLRLSLTIAPRALGVSAEVEALNLNRLPATLLPGFGLGGRVEGTLSYQEDAGSRQGSADLQLTQAVFRGLSIPAGQLRGSLKNGRVKLEGSAQLGHGALALSGEGPLPKNPGTLRVDLTATGIVLDDFTGLVPELAGTHAGLLLALRLRGDWEAPEVSLTGSATDLKGPWTLEPDAGALAEPLQVSLAGTLSPAGLSENLRVQAGQTPLLTLSGRAPIPSRKLVELFEVPTKLVREVLDAPIDQQLSLVGLPLAPIVRRLPWAPLLGGTLSAAASIRGTLRAPRGEVTLSAQQLAYQRQSLGNLEAKLSATDAGLACQADLRPPTGRLTASVDWRLAPEDLRASPRRLAAPLTADVRLAGLTLSTVMGAQSGLQGLAELSGRLRGSLSRPVARAKLSLHDLQLQGAQAGAIDCDASWNGTHLVAKASGRQPRGGQLEGEVDLPVTLQGALPDQPLTAALHAKSFELAPLGALVARSGLLRRIAGRLDSQLALRGTLRAPRPLGSIDLAGGQLALAGLGQYDQLEARVDIDGDGAEIRRVAGESAGGTFLATGRLHKDREKAFGVQIHLATERLGVFASDRLLGLLTSDEDLTGSIDRTAADLSLAVHRALFTLPTLVPRSASATTLDPDIVFLEAPRPATSSKAYAFRLSVVAPQALELKATDLDIEAHANLVVAVQGDSPMIQGGVVATHGAVNAYGRRFRLEHANLTFGHGNDFGPASDPTLDARASQSVGHYRLFVDVSGPLSNLKIAPSSEPPLDKEQVGELLVTGSADGLGRGSLASVNQTGGLAAASALGGLVSEKLREWLGPYMPLDVLTVDPNHLEAGKHLTPRLYVGAIENLGVTDPRVNGAEIHANYRLSDHWALDSNYGTAQAGDLDLQWTRSW